MIEKDYQYFDQNRDRFMEKHRNKHVLIHNEKEVEFFDTINDAFKYAAKHNYELGNFIIQKCITKEEETQKYHSRVGF